MIRKKCVEKPGIKSMLFEEDDVAIQYYLLAVTVLLVNSVLLPAVSVLCYQPMNLSTVVPLFIFSVNKKKKVGETD